MKKNIAILLPYKEKFNVDQAGAASIWVKDYLDISKLSSQTTVYGNLEKKIKPLTNNYKNIDLKNKELLLVLVMLWRLIDILKN